MRVRWSLGRPGWLQLMAAVFEGWLVRGLVVGRVGGVDRVLGGAGVLPLLAA
jgi:hypothetical protein